MFFQEATPNTSGYMFAGYIIAFLVMGLYVASLYLRSRNLKQDMTLLEDMEDSETAVPSSLQPALDRRPASLQEPDKNNGHRPTRAVTKTPEQK